MPMTVTKSADQLVESISAGEGWRFEVLILEEIGAYHVDDADWNYKDIPHARFVHKTIEGYLSFVTDSVMTSVMRQNIGPLRFPLTMVLYASRPDRQTYHTSFGPFVMIVETSWQLIASNRTKVSTRYYVGAQPLVLRLTWPFWKRLLRRNYAALMKDDLPMRRRRGVLRDRGYEFVREGEESYSYAATLNVMANHVVVPPSDKAFSTPINSLSIGVVEGLGEDDAFGLQVRRREKELDLYPRLCPHQGACLDGRLDSSDRMRCPWHGRSFPAVTIPIQDGSEAVCGSMRVMVRGDELIAMAAVTNRESAATRS